MIWTIETRYIVFLYPMRSMVGSAAKQPDIFPIHGREFIRAFRVGGSE